MKGNDWKGKVNRARYVERNILRWIKKEYDSEATLMDGYSPERDIISTVLGDVEIKEDRLAHITDRYAIEYVSGNGKPSGLGATLAKHWVIVDWDNVSLMATESLNYIIRQSQPLLSVEMGDRFDNGKQSKGWLLPRDAILHSPFVKVIKRWFPPLKENEVRK